MITSLSTRTAPGTQLESASRTRKKMKSKTTLRPTFTLILFDTLMGLMLLGTQLKHIGKRKQGPVLGQNRQLGPILRTHAEVIPDQSPVVRLPHYRPLDERYILHKIVVVDGNY